MAKKDYDALAKFVLDHVGGTENVVSLRHCVTRLRFKLKDESRADTEALENHEWIIDVIQKGGQYQVVIGNDVEDAFDAVMKLGKFAGSASDVSDVNDNEGKSAFDRIVDMISAILTPTIPLLAGCGIIKGLLAFCTAMKWLDSTSGFVQILSAAGDSLFYFFPIFLGYTSAEKFGMNKLLGMAIGATLVHPTIVGLKAAEPLFTLFEGTPIATNVTTTFLGIPVLMVSYTSSVMPIIAATFFGARVEKFFKKIVPDVVKMFVVPAATLSITVVLTLLLVGPVVTWISQLIAAGITAVQQFSPVLTGVLVGGLWQVLVVFGLHHAFTPIALNSLMVQGYENLTCYMAAVPFTTMAVVLAVYLRTKDKKLKSVALPAAISSFFGVSEPSIYGVTLPLKRPFAFTLVSSAVGGAILGFFGCMRYTQGGLGFFNIPAFINPASPELDMTFYGVFVALGVAMAMGFLLTFFFGVPAATAQSADDANVDADADVQIKQEVFVAPVAGEVVALEDVDDEVFASGSVGKGVAVKPSEGTIVAPADGEVTMLFKTGHAVGITTASGAELLIHIGIDTVQLDGRGFEAQVKMGDSVKQGQPLVTFDRDVLASEGYDDTVIFLVSNSASFQDVVRSQDASASTDRELLAVLV
ncbi:beta-glucoside-specific PTS transporter subunit IIABC [uncultured Collinsella sp.]|uniref:beta-glucoside-specific PTS transporter subunit IIABC n=1 Tax=uncultured Collinsella sp. TaxID=165190 RepID=UPI002672AB3B|nr:beta-glucoside-specific PTS transporter subunit IIABC [uncultured Collinsella sp.]